MGGHTIDYDSRRKVFWVKKKDLNDLTRELTSLGVKWRLSRAARKQLKDFETK